MASKKTTSARYSETNKEKIAGITYTPKILSDFVAQEVTEAYTPSTSSEQQIRILDPAIGAGELVISLLEQLSPHKELFDRVQVNGFDTDRNAISVSYSRISKLFPHIDIILRQENFLDYFLKYYGLNWKFNLFNPDTLRGYDLIIANPPYVRTQILGAEKSRLLAAHFKLKGRIDLYYPFLRALASVLKPEGILGAILSNRFMTTRSGRGLRELIRNRFSILKVWDLGDTKLFKAAVLPGLILTGGKTSNLSQNPVPFTSIYECPPTGSAEHSAQNPIDALSLEGLCKLKDGRYFKINQGFLDISGPDHQIWRLATKRGNTWLKTVAQNTWGTFRSLGKIRVGVKTCADSVFIRSDWDTIKTGRPELLQPLTTHHIANPFQPLVSTSQRELLYPHRVIDGKRQAVPLQNYPKSKTYLEKHREILESRNYVLEAGRKWYELWVPQQPDAWSQTKLVFRDISQKSTFWIDTEGTIINGDCYWLAVDRPEQSDLLWLAAAVGNSSFIEKFYDYHFHNKLYSGRRRFITQYVEKFPLPDPDLDLCQQIIMLAKKIHKTNFGETKLMEQESNRMVWQAFGVPIETKS